VPSDRTRGNGHKLKHRRFALNSRKHIFTVRVTRALSSVAQEHCRVFILGDIQKTFGQVPGPPALGGPA